MAKKVKTMVKLQIPAGGATPAPPVGSALGPHGLNIMEFCKAFNTKTSNVEKDMLVPVVISVYEDRSFTFITKTPPASVLLRKACGLEKGQGSKMPQKEKVATISMDKVREIAETKMPDLNANDIDAAAKIISGTARSMGIVVEG